MKLGYARVSTSKQTLDSQIERLQFAGCEMIFSDIITGTRASSPGFDEMNRNLRSGDIVVITSLCRLGRSNRFLIPLIREWEERSVHLQLLSHNIDTTTPQGKFMFDIMATLAEQERNVIQERIKKGVENARARGRSGGRPKKLNLEEIKKMKKIYDAQSLSVIEICRLYKITPPTFYTYINQRL